MLSTMAWVLGWSDEELAFEEGAPYTARPSSCCLAPPGDGRGTPGCNVHLRRGGGGGWELGVGGRQTTTFLDVCTLPREEDDGCGRPCPGHPAGSDNPPHRSLPSEVSLAGVHGSG